MKPKFIIFTWLFAIGLFSPVLLKAQDAPPTNAKVISVTTSTDATIRLELKADTDNTPVWIETSSGNFTKKFIGSSDGFSNYTVSGTSLKVYGDVTWFNCSFNFSKIKALDVSQNTALTNLECSRNSLSSLDVSQNTALTDLSFSDNNLSTLDISQNTALTDLSCYNNNLSNLDVSQNTALTYLSCSNNNLSTLDVSQNTALTFLVCESNNISSLDVSQNTALVDLNCSKNNLSSLNVSQNTALIYLFCRENNLSSLDVSQNIALEILLCDENNLSSLDVSQSTALKRLECNHNSISSLDVSQNSALIRLHCQNNSLVNLNVANGNNKNFIGYGLGIAFYAINNPNLKCIQIDKNFSPPTTGDNKWLKDNTANWSTNCAVSTNDIEENQSFIKVYPNPTKDFVTVSGLNEGLITKIEVFGMAGEKVMELSSNQTQVRVNLGTLSTGTYVVIISNEEQNQSFKLIKK